MTNPKPLDRRSRRTRVMLRDALVELILEKGYEAITIQDIADRADLARATFYLHFKDKEDLLATSLEELYDELVARTRLHERITALPEQPYSLIAFQHAQENVNLYRILLNGQGLGVIVQRIREHLAAHITNMIRALAGSRDLAMPPEVLANYLVGALLGMVAWWLDEDMPKSAEEMANTYRQICLKGMIGMLGIDASAKTD